MQAETIEKKNSAYSYHILSFQDIQWHKFARDYVREMQIVPKTRKLLKQAVYLFNL